MEAKEGTEAIFWESGSFNPEQLVHAVRIHNPEVLIVMDDESARPLLQGADPQEERGIRNTVGMDTVGTSSTERPEWLEFLHENEWAALLEILSKTSGAEIEVMLGGGLALAAYMPLRRWTKDVDFYIHPADKEKMIQLLSEAGFRDFYDDTPYDRGWIYRSIRDEVIIDVIWSFANYLTEVDEEWFQNARSFPCAGHVLKVIPPEELLWAKLFVFQRERCDWPDLLNLVYYNRESLNWDRLMARLGENRPLLDALLGVAQWLNPEGDAVRGDRVRLLDSRPWYLPHELRAKS